MKYSANPVLPRFYKGYTDLVYFRLPIATLDYYDLTPTPPLQEHYDYGQKRVFQNLVNEHGNIL